MDDYHKCVSACVTFCSSQVWCGVHSKTLSLNLNADEVGEGNMCPICQSLLISEDGTQRKQRLTQQQSKDPRRLPCGHIFHLSCLVRWITHNQGRDVVCPMCRAPLHSDAHNVNCWQATAVQILDWWMECPWQLVCLPTRTTIWHGFLLQC